MSRYVKKPIEIEALQVIKKRYENLSEGYGDLLSEFPEWLCEAVNKSIVVFVPNETKGDRITDIMIKTLEGEMIAEPGSYIIKGVEGEIYPCKESIFNKTYNEVENE